MSRPRTSFPLKRKRLVSLSSTWTRMAPFRSPSTPRRCSTRCWRLWRLSSWRPFFCLFSDSSASAKVNPTIRTPTSTRRATRRPVTRPLAPTTDTPRGDRLQTAGILIKIKLICGFYFADRWVGRRRCWKLCLPLTRNTKVPKRLKTIKLSTWQLSTLTDWLVSTLQI